MNHMNHMSQISQERIQQIRKNAEAYVPSAEAILAKFAEEAREDIAEVIAKQEIDRIKSK